MSTLLLVLDFCALSAAAWWIYRRQPPSLKRFYWPALILKLIAGFGVGLLYFSYYGYGDTITFWNDSVLVSRNLWSNPMDTIDILWNADSIQDGPLPGLSYRIDRSFFFVKILGIVAFFFGNNYWMMASALSLVSFLAAWRLVRIITEQFPDAKAAAVIAFLFFPPVVFWSSGVIKESVGLAALYFAAGICFTWAYRRTVRLIEIPIIALSIWIGWSLKYYWVMIFVAAAIPFVTVSLAARRAPFIQRNRLSLWVVMTILMILIGMNAHPNFDPARLSQVIVENNAALMRLSDSQHAVQYELTPNLWSLIVNSPRALMAGLFRPFIWETFNGLSFFAGLANAFVLLAVLFAIPSLKNVLRSQNNLLVVSILFHVIALAIFLALSTPNFGTLDRLKIGYTPFLLCLALYHNAWIRKTFASAAEAPAA